MVIPPAPARYFHLPPPVSHLTQPTWLRISDQPLAPPSAPSLEMPDVILSLPDAKRFEDGDFDLGELGKRLTGVFIDKPQRNEILRLMEGSVGLVIECLDKVNEIISRSWTLSAYRALDHLIRYPQNRFRYPGVLRSGLRDLKTPSWMSTPPSALLD